MKTANNILVLAALLAGAAAGWLGAAAGGGTRPPERAGEGVEQVGSAEESITVRLDATNNVAAVGVASARSDAPLRPAADVRPIRPSSDAGVQKRILTARVATLEKQLAMAQRRAEARKAETHSAESAAIDYIKKAQEECISLSKNTGKENIDDCTVGECLQYAPTWFNRNVDGAVDVVCTAISQVSEALAILDSVDISRLTEEEKATHGKYAEALCEYGENLRNWLEMTDKEETRLDEIWKRRSALYGEDRNRLREIADAERDALRAMVLREFGVTDDEAEVFKADEQQAIDSVNALLDCTLRVWL